MTGIIIKLKSFFVIPFPVSNPPSYRDNDENKTQSHSRTFQSKTTNQITLGNSVESHSSLKKTFNYKSNSDLMLLFFDQSECFKMSIA